VFIFFSAHSNNQNDLQFDTGLFPIPPLTMRDIEENKSIFLLEFRPPYNLTGRKLCAMESAAMKNPKSSIIVIIDTRDMFFQVAKGWKLEMTSKDI